MNVSKSRNNWSYYSQGIIPYKDLKLGKKEQVRLMFNSIAHRYDFLNRLLSLRIDVLWRRKAVKMVSDFHPAKILDVCTGTADFAIELTNLSPEKITGIDIAENMLEIGRAKIKHKGLEGIIELQTGDCERLAFNDNTFDLISSAFGVRNFENLVLCLNEMYRILVPGGTLLILEFGEPLKSPFKKLYKTYMSTICPSIGGLFTESKAYSYLNDSVTAFPSGKDFIGILKSCGFKDTECYPLSLGIAYVYIAKK